MSEPDYNLYPSQEMQLDWLHTYLQAYKLFTKKGEEVSQHELETLYVQVNKFALVSVACAEDIRKGNAGFMKLIYGCFFQGNGLQDCCMIIAVSHTSVWIELEGFRLKFLFFRFGRPHISSGVSGP